MEEIQRDHILCRDISHQITFIRNWQRENITRGLFLILLVILNFTDNA